MTREEKREYDRKYRQTKKGRESQKKHWKKRQQTDEFKEYQKKYKQTDKYKECKKNYQQNDEYKKCRRRCTLINLYGLSSEQYDKILLSQDGVCAICGRRDKRGRKLGVDHSHTTGKIRGLLCSNCNIGIGNLEDNIQILKKAINYLKSY